MWQQEGFDFNQIRRFIAFCKLMDSMVRDLIDREPCDARLKSICLLKRAYVGCSGRVCRGMREKRASKHKKRALKHIWHAVLRRAVF
jgi:hypothetical protein